jgi:hypothetical protein
VLPRARGEIALANEAAGEAGFAPAARLAHNLGEDRFVGLEYYADFCKIGGFPPLRDQYQEFCRYRFQGGIGGC